MMAIYFLRETQVSRVIASISSPQNDETAYDRHFNGILSGVPKVQWQHFLDWLGEQPILVIV